MATKDFVTYSPNSGNGSKDVSVSASKNTSSISRSTTLNIQYKLINKNVNCSQKAAAINDGNIVQTQISSWITQLLIDKGGQNNYHYKLIYPISNPTQENANSILNLFLLATFLDLYSFFHKERSRKYLKDIRELLKDLSTNK